MYQFVFNEANRQGIQTAVMIVRTDIDNGLPCKLTRPGKEDSFRPCGDCVVVAVTRVQRVQS